MDDLTRATRPADRPQDAAAFVRGVRRLSSAAGVAIVDAAFRVICHDGAPVPPFIGQVAFEPTSRVWMGQETPRFLLSVPIPTLDPNGRVWLVLWDDLRRSDVAAYRLLGHLNELVAHAGMDRRRAFEAHRKAMVERASATARIGIWSCSLPDETLHWTEGIYDLFELPRGAPIDRQQTLRMYVPESARQMQALRSEAIATLGDFNFDAEIITAKGNRRWMRITATVDGVDGKARRIFGMKQNITEEKLMAEETRRLAETDTLTGLANRATFNSRLQALRQCPAGALVLIDLDNFKSINDTLGHAAGDACLVETGRRLRQCVPHGGVVARLGGDEFAIVVDRAERADLSALSDGILRAFDRPFKLGGTQRQVGVSLGLARAVGQDAETLYRNADTALYAAKSAGRGVWRLYQAA